MSSSIFPDSRTKRQSSSASSFVSATRHAKCSGRPEQGEGQPVAAIYARVSTEDQGKGYSLPTQIASCRQLLQREGYSVPEHYILSDDVTGKTLERPGLQTLRDLVRTQSIQVYRLRSGSSLPHPRTPTLAGGRS